MATKRRREKLVGDPQAPKGQAWYGLVSWQLPTPPGWWQAKHARTLAAVTKGHVQQKLERHAEEYRLLPGSLRSKGGRKGTMRRFTGGTGGSGSGSGR